VTLGMVTDGDKKECVRNMLLTELESIVINLSGFPASAYQSCNETANLSSELAEWQNV
jgi:hypothetical protein